MVESNYDILGVPYGASKKQIREAFRKLALKHHTDRGGDPEQFKKIKQAFEDLKDGIKYPMSEKRRLESSRFYHGDSEEEQRKKNLLLSKDIADEVRLAQDWAGALNRAGATGTRLFGSKELGMMEMEVRANGALAIKGKFWAGNLSYDDPITMWGSITNPYFSEKEEHKTRIKISKGKFSIIDPIKNGFELESGAKIIVEEGDIIVGNVTGKIENVPDPKGRVGMFITKEHWSELRAPKGKIVAGNLQNTVKLEADEILVGKLEDNVKIKGRKISVLGKKVTYDVVIELMKGGVIRFFDQGSGFDISDDAKLYLENGKMFRLDALKVSKFIGYGGEEISYEQLDNWGVKQEHQKGKHKSSKFGGFRKALGK